VFFPSHHPADRPTSGCCPVYLRPKGSGDIGIKQGANQWQTSRSLVSSKTCNAWTHSSRTSNTRSGCFARTGRLPLRLSQLWRSASAPTLSDAWSRVAHGRDTFTAWIPLRLSNQRSTSPQLRMYRMRVIDATSFSCSFFFHSVALSPFAAVTSDRNNRSKYAATRSTHFVRSLIISRRAHR
jgi:hypothetical protein